MSDHTRSTVEALTLNDREAAQLMGISRSTFYTLKKQGRFEGLQAPLLGRWSRRKLEQWLTGQPVQRRGAAA